MLTGRKFCLIVVKTVCCCPSRIAATLYKQFLIIRHAANEQALALAPMPEKTMRVIGWTLCLVALALSATGHSAEPQHHSSAIRASTAADRAEGVIGGDYFGAGATTGPETPVGGDAFVAGAAVDLRSPVAGDAVLSGGQVYVGAKVGSDLYAAGGSVVVNAAVGHNARLAGGRVRVTPHADIAGKMTIAGSKIRVEGRTGGVLVVFGNEVVINGEVNGGAAVVARQLKIGPNTRIRGRLTYRTAQAPQISPLAIISEGAWQSEFELPGKKLEPLARMALWVGVAMFTCGLFLLGMAIVTLAPRGSASVVKQLRSRPVGSLLLGFALLVGVPVAAVLAMMTVIGVPLGLLLLFLWPVVAVFGYLIGVIFLGDALASLFSRVGRHGSGRGLRVLGLAVVLIALLLLSRLELIGAVAILLILFCGTGALLIGLRNAVR